MDRRDFIKYSTCLALAGGLGVLGYHKFCPQNSSPFFYKSKKDLPKRIGLEACNECQLNCVRCWMREEEEYLKSINAFGYLKFQDFKNLVDNYDFDEIELSANGEIFLNPELGDIIKYAYEKGIGLTAFNGVNLNTLTEEMAEILVKYQFRLLWVSIDGATQEVYQIYRRGGDFNKVLDNIRMIQKYKEKYNSEFPEIVYKFIIFGHNEHETVKAKEIADSLGIKILYELNAFPEYSPWRDYEWIKKTTGFDISAMKQDENASQDILLKTSGENDNSAYQKVLKDSFCGVLFHRPQIDWNGNLLGCCINYGDMNFGVNVFKEGLLNALNNPNVLYGKQMVTDLSTPPKEECVCSKCAIYNGIRENNTPFKYKS
ncbi:radical SAM protein [bacterium]|nr:radical SAM protein [bacterium]